MSDDNEERGGISAGGVILGAGGATGAAYLGDKMLSRNGVAEAWKGAKEAPKAVTEKVTTALTDPKNAALKSQSGALNEYSQIINSAAAPTPAPAPNISNTGANAKVGLTFQERRALKVAEKAAIVEPVAAGAKVESMKYATDAAGKHALQVESSIAGAKPINIALAEIPKGQVAGTVITGDAVKAGIKNAEAPIKAAEKTLTTELRAATGLNKVGSGLKFGSNMGRCKVAAAVVAAAAVSYGIGNMMFPSHTRRIDNERAAQRDMGRA